jgi:RNA polymerase sigma factor (sigma-70 family)
MFATPSTESTDVAALVQSALRREPAGWNALVRRYSPLVTSVVRRYRLTEADAQDAAQTVWLKLVENLGKIRDPAALPGWIVTTAQREALALIRSHQRLVTVDSIELMVAADSIAVDTAGPDAALLRAEEASVIRDGLGELKAEQREFLSVVVGEPSIGYREIGQKFNMPTGSIGPTRARHLRKLRETAAVRSYAESLAS